MSLRHNQQNSDYGKLHRTTWFLQQVVEQPGSFNKQIAREKYGGGTCRIREA